MGTRARKKEDFGWIVREKDRKMKTLLDGISNIMTKKQKAKLFPYARQWVDNDPDFVDLGQMIQATEWENLKAEMLENFVTKDEDIQKFEKNEHSVVDHQQLSEY